MSKNKRILLIYPPFPLGKAMSSVMCSPPLNLLTLAGVSNDNNIDILDLNVDKSYGIKEIGEKIENYDIIGITCMSFTFRIVLNICRIAKKKGKITILGGFHPTLKPNIIDKFKCVDMIIRGEGELTFKELLEGKPKKDILGLSYRENGEVIHNPDRPFIKNLDELPFPKNELIDSEPYNYLWIPAWVCESSRGCPYNCHFCCVQKFYERSYRTKSPERVIKELQRVPESAKLVFFVDDNFTLNKKRVMRICELIQKTHLNRHLMFVCQSRVDDIANNPDMVKQMHKSGFICFFLGFESFKQTALNEMEKGYNLDKVKKCVDTCHNNGIMVFGSFIIGNIGETKQDTRKTFKLMKYLNLDFMMTMPLTPFPGTRLYNDAQKNGWIDKDLKWESIKTGESKPLMRTPDLSREDILQLLSESYRSFYADKEHVVRKYATSYWSSKFNWTRRYTLSFIIKGITQFIWNLREIVDENYLTI
jgi:radical SAM superfamily enzyme YgiQ (UPF0313 family)